MIFGADNSFLKKKLLGSVLNPFLDTVRNFGFKNIGLTPGEGSGCFQSSQDVVSFYFNYREKQNCGNKQTM